MHARHSCSLRLALGVTLSAAAAVAVHVAAAAADLESSVVAWEHDARRWTEGLLCAGGTVYESTGMWGISRVFAAAWPPPPSAAAAAGGRPLVWAASDPLPGQRFGEGIAMHGGVLQQLTYQDGEVWRYDATAAAGAHLIPVSPPSRLPPHAPAAAVAADPAAGSAVEATLSDLLRAAADDAGLGGSSHDRSGGGGGALEVARVEAWGATTDTARGTVVVSDGSLNLHHYSADLTAYLAPLPVVFPSAASARCPGAGPAAGAPPPRLRLNELEYIPGATLRTAAASTPCGTGSTAPPPTAPATALLPPCGAGDEVWAAVQGCASILRINACTGTARAWVTFPSMWPSSLRTTAAGGGAGVGGDTLLAGGSEARFAPAAAAPTVPHQHASKGDLNGIALCAASASSPRNAAVPSSSLLVTGKYWDVMLEVPLAAAVTAWSSCLAPPAATE